ncbi:hypothetical protein FPZ42_07645 [Mucilaginibacter achroorhodeus]|uniref:Uncharacterized protein n=1 Tax=Mucilaginibacter achroorhodeus TaxID=2599294 RepID=A0A563U6G3_9SPHI|nr:hypothetical protein FPZ42_07645 [Mucilaginibacter achroorhodeus]
MILIDKSKLSQLIILTVSELATIENPKYLMVVQSDALRTFFRFHLPDNESQYLSRFDSFTMLTSQFEKLVPGFYSYSIYEFSHDVQITDDVDLGKSLESGKLLVKGEIEQVEIISPIRNDSYLIYH